MSGITIKFGGKPLTLTKSPELVAIKPASGRAAAMNRSVARLGVAPTRQHIGGFEVVNVAAAEQPMEETLDALRADETIGTGSHVYHTSDDQVPFVPTGQLFVAFKPDAPREKCQELIESQSLEILQARGQGQFVVRVTPESPNPVKAAEALQQSPLVEVAEPDLATPAKLTAFTIPSDSLLARQWHLRNTGTIDGESVGLKAGADARVVAAWQAAGSLGSPQAIIAVIDDGFDLTHPDLSVQGKVLASWDFTRNTNDPRPEFNASYPEFKDGEWQGDWHGTACAGVAVGAANTTGILGAAPGSRLMPVRWGVNLSDAQVEAWFDYVREQGAWVVSCSWGAAAKNFPLSTRQALAIAKCAQEGRGGLGCVVCFAAGNENRNVNSPSQASVAGFAIHPDVIAVAASTSRDKRSHYSNFGKEISVCAPSSGAGGWGILTTDVLGTFARNGQLIESGYSVGEFTYEFGGTSSATPLVAGICALLLSIKPTLTAVQVKKLIESTARRIGPSTAYNSQGHSTEFGFGCINAEAAVEKLLGDVPSPAHASNARRPSRRRLPARASR